MEFLGLDQVLIVNSHQLFQFVGRFIGWVRPGGHIGFFFKQNPYMVFTVEFEQCLAYASILGIVAGKLSYL